MSKKRLFLISLVVYPLLFAATSAGGFKKWETPIEIEPKPIQPVEIVQIDEIEPLIEAMIMVESTGNDSAVGDTHLGEPSIGVLQIRPIMVREVNRILKLKGESHRFKMKDRFSREKSIQMFLIWKEFHHNDSDFEAIARSWNGGTKGPQNPKTYSYWKKVETQLALN